MMTFFTDLDNTLLFSHRHMPPEPRQAVEWLKGKEQSYMTTYSLERLTGQRELRIVPLTTRTLPQLQRLEGLLRQLRCWYVLACNGAVLLRDGEPDPAWLAESRSLAGRELEELPKAEAWLRQRCGETSTHSDQGVLTYAACEDPAALRQELAAVLDMERVELLCDRRKLYCIPRSLNKGAALRRFREQFPAERCVAAGDSAFDLPMLEAADLAIVPQALAGALQNQNRFSVPEEVCFSDGICDILTAINTRDGALCGAETE